MDFENCKCTNITCPNCGAKGDDNIGLFGISYEAGSNSWTMAEYGCYKCHHEFVDIMNYDIEEVVVIKKIYHMKNQREFTPNDNNI